MPKPWPRLEHSQALLDGYLHPLLGAGDFRELKELLGDVLDGYDADGRSRMAQRLLSLDGRLSQADIEAYDDNIKRHLDRINAARPADERIILKYFQYLALFYTEHVLHRFFLDRDAFLADLNGRLPAFCAARHAEAEPFPSFTAADLTKLAFWMATGSGKTLLLHINYLQFLHVQARRREEAKQLEYQPLERTHANLQPNLLADGRPGYLVRVNRGKPGLVQQVKELIQEGNRLWQQDTEALPNVYFDRHLYQPLLVVGLFEGDAFKLAQDIRTVPVALNRGEANFPRRVRDFLVAHPGYLGGRKLYLLRNQSRGKGVSFFEAGEFYPDFILWLADGPRQRIVFVDPKGLAMLKPNDFSHPKIQLFSLLQEIASQIGDPDVTLNAFVVSDQPYEKTRPLFGTGAHTRQEFEAHHVLFPNDANLARKIIG